MTSEILKFARDVKSEFNIVSGKVLEVGSRFINGSVRPIFEDSTCIDYIGIDAEPGKFVDVVLDAYEIDNTWGEETFDTVICCETLEHLLRPWIVVDQMRRVLKTNGTLFISTPTFRFPEHRYPIDCYRFGQDTYKGFIFDRMKILKILTTKDPCICCIGIKRSD